MLKAKFPNLWHETSLGNICEIIGGGTPNRSQKKYFSGDIPWVTPTYLTNIKSLYIAETADYISEEGLNNSSARLLPPGTVLMTSRATIGRTAIAQKSMATNQGFANFICNSEVLNNEYLARYLNASKEYLISRAGGTTFKEISKSNLAKIKIPIPPLPEQERIVHILRQADELQKFQNDTFLLIEKVAIKLFWKFFCNYFTEEGIKNEVRLGKYIEESQYGTSTSINDFGGTPLLRMNNITFQGWMDTTDLKFVTMPVNEYLTYTLKKGDILFNRTNSRELVGKTGLLEKNYDGFAFASYLIRIRLKEGLLPEYVWGLLNSEYGKKKLYNIAKQAGNMANINATELGNIAIPKADLSLQRKFAASVEVIREIRSKIIKKNECLEQLVQNLSSQAFTGELTESWREKNKAILEKAAKKPKPSRGIFYAQGIKTEFVPEEIPWLDQSKRHWLMDQLSDLQRWVYDALRKWEGTLIPSEDLDEFHERAFQIEHLENAKNRILRALHQLAELGLIAKISLYNQEEGYVTAFRGLREGEFTQGSDQQYLARRG